MGRFFSFSGKKSESVPVDADSSKMENLGDEGSGHPLLAQARESAKAAMELSPRRRGRPSKDKEPLRTDSRTLPKEVQDEIARQLEGALDPRAWAALLALPADTALALSGREHWKISKEERETLGATGSALARTMMISSPKMLCAIMLSSAMFSVYMPRVSKEMELYRQQKAAKAMKTPEGEKKP